MSNKGKRPDEIEFNTIVGKNIRYLRKEKRLTQKEVGAAIGVSFQQVQKYEKGLNGLHSYSLYKVAHRVFNVNMDVLADPQMITKHKGFSEEITDDQMNAALKKAEAKGYLEPKVCVGSLDQIKDQLKKDGIDPEESIMPTLRKLKKENSWH